MQVKVKSDVRHVLPRKFLSVAIVHTQTSLITDFQENDCSPAQARSASPRLVCGAAVLVGGRCVPGRFTRTWSNVGGPVTLLVRDRGATEEAVGVDDPGIFYHSSDPSYGGGGGKS